MKCEVRPSLHEVLSAQHCHKLILRQELGAETKVHMVGWPTMEKALMKTVLAATGVALSLLVGGIANAASTSTNASSNTPPYAKPVVADADAMKAADELHHTSIRQQLQDKLTQAGYTSVKITPSSFFVEAKNKQGSPVQILIGPDSFTEITALAPKTASATAQQTPMTNSTRNKIAASKARWRSSEGFRLYQRSLVVARRCGTEPARLGLAGFRARAAPF